MHVNYLGLSACVFCRYIWGRGAQDVKITVFALLEAVTNLLDQGWASDFYQLLQAMRLPLRHAFPAKVLLHPSE